jgi:hypothetical protein
LFLSPFLPPPLALDPKAINILSRCKSCKISSLTAKISSSTSPSSTRSSHRSLDLILIEKSGHTTLALVSNPFSKASELKKCLDNREALESDDPRASVLTDIEVIETVEYDYRADEAVFDTLHKQYNTMRSDIAILRCRVEEAHLNEKGFYKYGNEVKYQGIGNQKYPAGYKHPKAGTGADKNVLS